MGSPSRPPPPVFGGENALSNFRSAIGSKYKTYEDFAASARRHRTSGRLVYDDSRVFSDAEIDQAVADSVAAGNLARQNPGSRGAPNVYSLANITNQDVMHRFSVSLGNRGMSYPANLSFGTEAEFRKYLTDQTVGKDISEVEARRLFAEMKSEDIAIENRMAAERIKANATRDAQKKLQQRGASSALAGGSGTISPAVTSTETSLLTGGLGDARRRTVLGG